MQLKVNEKLCVGCLVCQIACSVEHKKEFNIRRGKIKVPFSHPMPSVPIICKQCKKAPCVSACSTGALNRDDKLQIVVFKQEKCDRCYDCVTTCPFDAIFIDPLDGFPQKCDCCLGKPACVDLCLRKALYIND